MKHPLRETEFVSDTDKKTDDTYLSLKFLKKLFCEAKTLAYSTLDAWLYQKLKHLKACNGKLEGVRVNPIGTRFRPRWETD